MSVYTLIPWYIPGCRGYTDIMADPLSLVTPARNHDGHQLFPHIWRMGVPLMGMHSDILWHPSGQESIPTQWRFVRKHFRTLCRHVKLRAHVCVCVCHWASGPTAIRSPRTRLSWFNICLDIARWAHSHWHR